MVGHAARVHARFGPTVRVWPVTANAPLQTLQSARVEMRPSANVIEYAAGDAWLGWPAGCKAERVQLPDSWPVVSASEPPPAEAEVGDEHEAYRRRVRSLYLPGLR